MSRIARLLAAVLSGVAAPSTLLDGLVAYWKLEEASGTRVDATGRGNDLTDNNTVTQATGKVGFAAQCTAANSESLSRADNADLRTGDVPYTVAFWAYIDSVSSFPSIVAKDEAAKKEFSFYLIDGTPNTLVFEVFNGNATSRGSRSGTVADGEYAFVVGWHDSEANTVNLQINNGLVASTATSGATGSSDSFFSIGRGSAGFFNGRVDEVGKWDRVLTADERTELYNGGNGTTYPF